MNLEKEKLYYWRMNPDDPKDFERLCKRFLQEGDSTKPTQMEIAEIKQLGSLKRMSIWVVSMN